MHRPNHNVAARDEFVKWFLSEKFSWDYFLHLTWREKVSVKGAKRAIERLTGRYVGFGVFGIEYGQLGGLLHAHGIMEAGFGTRAQDIWRWWFKKYGRNKVEEVDKTKLEKAIKYCTKYMLKGGQEELMELYGVPRSIAGDGRIR